MENIMLADIDRVVYTKEQLDAAIDKLGKQISEDYKDRDLLLVCILKGSVIVMSDLMRALSIPCAIDFMVVSSYGGDTKSSGRVRIIKDIELDVSKYDLLIVEDIFDSGETLESLTKMLQVKNPRSLKICAMINRIRERGANIHVRPDYVGLNLEDDGFLVGYGLDCNQKYRNLPFIGVLTDEAIGKNKSSENL